MKLAKALTVPDRYVVHYITLLSVRSLTQVIENHSHLGRFCEAYRNLTEYLHEAYKIALTLTLIKSYTYKTYIISFP